MNPFEKVFDALWSLIEDHADVSSVFKKGNRIKFDTRDEFKSQIAASDVPEIILVLSDGIANLGRTSSSTSFTQDYEWLVSTGDLRISGHILKVKWFLFTAHLNWSTKLGALVYNGASFVKRVSIVSTRTGQADPERNRGVKGWSTVWRTQVEMHFKTSDLLAETTIGDFGAGFDLAYN